MPHQPEQYIEFAPFGAPADCQECVFAKGVVAAGNAALRSLREKYDERPDYVSSRERSCFVGVVQDVILRTTDEEYAALAATYEGSSGLRDKIKDECAGGTIIHTVGEPSRHLCGYGHNQEIPPELPPLER